MANNNLLAAGFVAFLLLGAALIIIASPSDDYFYKDENIKVKYVFVDDDAEPHYTFTFVSVSGEGSWIFGGDLIFDYSPFELDFWAGGDGGFNFTFINADEDVFRYTLVIRDGVPRIGPTPL